VRKLTLVAAALLLAACSKDIQNSDAVKQGVIDYLQQKKGETGLDMKLMQVDVASVTFDKNQAHAVVVFRPKNSADAAGMQMAYTLDRKGNQWVVASHNESGASPHGAGGMPGMPPGHPAVPGASGAQGQQLPPGHPPIGSKQ
jgi:hypothetical protein